MTTVTKLQQPIKNFAEFKNLLDKLPKDVETRLAQNSTLAAMRYGRNFIAAAAPVHKGAQSKASQKYGTLRENIRVGRLRRLSKGQKGAVISTGDAFWGLIYELGNYIQQELGTRYQAARPWFAPAFKGISVDIIDKLGKSLGEGIIKQAIKYRKL